MDRNPHVGPASAASMLVVDDSRSIRETLAGILRQSGYRVESAVAGAQTAIENLPGEVVRVTVHLPQRPAAPGR